MGSSVVIATPTEEQALWVGAGDHYLSANGSEYRWLSFAVEGWTMLHLMCMVAGRVERNGKGAVELASLD